MNNKYIWKCRCMGNGNKHDGGIELMSGTWKIHRSLVHRIYPYGLHRVFYQVEYKDLDNLFDKIDGIKVVYRNSNKLLRIC